jgi:hypothetical protein
LETTAHIDQRVSVDQIYSLQQNGG